MDEIEVTELMVAGVAGANGFRTELREPTADELAEYAERSEGP